MFNWKKKENEAESSNTGNSGNIESQEVEVINSNPEVMASTSNALGVSDNNTKEVDITTQDQKVTISEPNPTPPLTRRELKYLKRSDYEKISKNDKFTTAYVLKNVRTGQIVELRAASSFHACNIVGWKPNRVRLIKEKKIEIKEESKA